jgi:hypothetical protein
MARQRYSHQSAPCHRATPVSVDRAAFPTPHARRKSPASRRGRAKSRETRTLRWRKTDSNFWFRTKAEHFPYRPEPGAANRPGTYNRDFDDRYRQVYRAPSQAGSGNDIYTGSPGLRKAPMWARQPGRYSGSSGPVPSDDVLVEMRAPIVGRDNFAIERDLLRLPAL